MKHKRFRFLFFCPVGLAWPFPNVFPEDFPKISGVVRVLRRLHRKERFHRTTLRPRSKEAVTIEIMARDLMQGKRIYDKLKNQARQQLALMIKCRMRKTGGKGVARSATSGDACLSKNQPFYVQFLNR